jgi:predicted AlkP superfamily pyrophosphatase or phosphodiesterase
MTCASAAPPEGSGLLLVSIDGMNPAYVLEADKYGLKIPNLRRLVREGAHATAVRGVLPTVTYPTHTTMLTGVAPARHGIYSNVAFDPENKNQAGWYWYAEDVKAPTLWAAASKAGYTVGSVAWPVSVSAPGVTHLIPEYWRSMTGPDDVKILRAISSPGLLTELEKKHGKYIVDLDIAIPGDWMRTRYAASIIRDKRARVLTLHLAALDHIEHDTGPATPAGFKALEEIDAMVGELATAIRSVAPRATICIVSDHGMAKVDRTVNLATAFVKAGLITIGQGTAITDWKAHVWNSSGSVAIILRDPNDAATVRQVEQLLKTLAADPANGIAGILDRAAIAKAGGAPTASFWVDMQPGFAVGSAVTGELVRTTPVRGVHGYAPTHDVMRASFFISGPNIRPGASVGEIEMRHIAPTLAQALDVPFPTAELKPVDVFIPRH